MKNIALTALATLLVTSALLAGEAHVQKTMELVFGDDSDVLVIEDDDMEIGETRQFFTDSGKEVLITRTEDGRTIEIDGKTIEIAEDPADFVFSGDGESQVFIHKTVDVEVDGEGHGEHRTFSWTSEGGGDGGPHVMMIHRKSPATHLEESGALEGLDDATRQRILDTLRELDAPAGGFEWVERLGDGEDGDVRVIKIDKREIHEVHEGAGSDD